MFATAESLQVNHNAASRRFETQLGNEWAVLEYRLQNDMMFIMHTYVPPMYEGRGIASMITQKALDHAREAGWRVVPICSFASAYIRRHPEYKSLT